MHGSGGVRIAYLTGSFPKASHTFIQREIAGLRRRGIEVLPCAVRRPGAADITGAEERDALSETFYLLAAARNPARLVGAHLACLVRSPRRYLGAIALAARTAAPGLRRAVYQLFYFAEAGLLADHLRRRRADHLHNHFMDSSCTVAMLASRLSGIPFSSTAHGPTDFFAPAEWRLDAKIAEARFVVCISHFCRSQCMLFSAPADWDRLHIVHCGVEPARYARETAGDAAPGGRLRLVFVGRLAPVKGLRVLLEALAGPLGETGAAAELTVIGDGPDRPELERMAAALGLGERVAFVGYEPQERVAQRLAGADILVLPSFAEGVPVVLMEAMASGVPVIATRVGGVSELVEDGVSGLLVAPGDVAGLAAAVAALASDPERRRAMGAAGRQRVVAGYDIDVETGRLAALFAAYSAPDRARPPLRPEPEAAPPATGTPVPDRAPVPGPLPAR